MKGKRFILTVAASMLVLTSVFSGCSQSTSKETGADSKPAVTETKAANEVKYPEKPMEFIAPGGAGGGWDLTIRTVDKVLKDAKLVSVSTPITNKSGGGGGVALAYLQEKKGSDKIISVYSPPLLLINLNGSTNFSYKDTTPIAGLIADYGAFVVAKDSKYNTINEVFDALKNDPKSIKIGGNSAAGSMDHIQFLLMAKAAGVEKIKEIDYISFQDNAGAAQLLGGHIDLLTTGLGDIKALLESGDIKALAQTGSERVGEGVIAEVPTCKEQGIDGEFINWRGLFGAPDMPEYALKYWSETLEKMVKTPEWEEACKRNGWTQAYLNTDDFKSFLDKTNEEYKTVLDSIGMLAK